jgi:hypothetical protein
LQENVRAPIVDAWSNGESYRAGALRSRIENKKSPGPLLESLGLTKGV